MIDFLIIGGGIIGNFIASKLSIYDAKTVLLEKENDVSQIQTTHNSALVHSPLLILDEKGPLKSRLAKEGNTIYHALADKVDVPSLKNGALVLAFNEKEHEALKSYHKQAIASGFEETRLIDKATLKVEEPNLSDQVYSALELPSAMTAGTYEISRLLYEHASNNSVQYQFNQTVNAIEYDQDHFIVKTKEGNLYKTKYVINAAGIYAEMIASLFEEHVPYKTYPHRGDYYVIKPKTPLVKHTLFPLPTEETKGILVIPQPDGTVRLGPTSVLQPRLESETVDSEAIEFIKQEVSKYLDNIPFEALHKMYVGVRSTIDYGDFYIKPSTKNSHFIHVAGIDSPGVTAAPAIANYLINEVITDFSYKLDPKRNPLI
jgi:glycerol-3-phosphate dehydrogenase